MVSKFCMNEYCRSTTSFEWKQGWGLKSGGFAALCYNCGSAYEKVAFCETFHLDESGWRECRMCRKRIHCGCIMSKYLFEYMDFGGIGCLSCTRCLGGHTIFPVQIPNEDPPSGIFTMKNSADTHTLLVENRTDQTIFENGRLLQFGNSTEESENDKIKQEQSIIPAMDASRLCFSNLNQQSPKTSLLEKAESCIPNTTLKDQLSLNFFLTTPMGNSGSVLPISSGVSPFQQGQTAHNIFPKAPKASSSSGFESKCGISTLTGVARPSSEGRSSKNQFLPRYWPRITDQELQKLSGDLKSSIVPLFEKVLSASDAGRIGRLVIPKACAEAYFPYITQSEGIPIRVQDVKGKEWIFQFRFWPNNNSRMYVLEGVTPCIQNMQLQAGDTVTFSRIDPGRKLFMGFRKAVNYAETQDSQNATIANGGCSPESPDFAPTENCATNVGKETDDSLQINVIVPEKKIKKTGSKNKRLLLNTEDAIKLKITCEEARDLLRPPPNVNPTIVVIEDCDFEEYDEPPIFGKRTVFTTASSGEQGQWAQCDSCFKWRRLPTHVLLPANWTCSDNTWDSNRSSCSAASEMNKKQLDSFHRACNKGETKRGRVSESGNDCETYAGLDALACIAVLGDDSIGGGGGDLGASEPSTTKHPRHRPGCTCIVCIQPPSGKGKHDPTCKCIVCLTVKRRFKTLMLRKKKKKSEREADIVQEKDKTLPDIDVSIDGPSLVQHACYPENDDYPNGDRGNSKGQLDLNCHPNESQAPEG
ncbi:unnamed protein product [Cuscuta epithymum]|uniref:Uncharacterized protein n=1 Tax=Cuscuta epithymum TaxID=186058 RepID=A0AAV0FSL1_9ASTE|nr:unnamed protein product [Cuscuta epithymum]